MDFTIGDQAFNLPPASYEFRPSNEINPAIRETAEEFGLATFESQNLVAATRRFEEITGTKVIYYTGGHPGLAGFTPPSRPNLIFDHENRETILDVCEKHGLQLVNPKDHRASTRRVQEISGAVPVYFQGGDPSDTGFAERNLIFIYAERDGIPTGFTMAHEQPVDVEEGVEISASLGWTAER